MPGAFQASGSAWRACTTGSFSAWRMASSRSLCASAALPGTVMVGFDQRGKRAAVHMGAQSATRASNTTILARARRRSCQCRLRRKQEEDG